MLIVASVSSLHVCLYHAESLFLSLLNFATLTNAYTPYIVLVTLGLGWVKKNLLPRQKSLIYDDNMSIPNL